MPRASMPAACARWAATLPKYRWRAPRWRSGIACPNCSAKTAPLCPAASCRSPKPPQELDRRCATSRGRAAMRSASRTKTIVDAQQVREIAPRLAQHVVGGIWVQRRRPCRAVPRRDGISPWRRSALGAEVPRGHAAHERIERVGGRWRVSTPRGVFMRAVAGQRGRRLVRRRSPRRPVTRCRSKPGGLMLMITQRAPPFVDPVLGATGRPLSFKQFANGTVLIGGGLRCPADVGAPPRRGRHAQAFLAARAR